MPLSKARDRERKRIERASKVYTGICDDCGYSECPSILVKHHIDGNKKNEVDSNLVKLCPNCHARRHSPNGCVSFISEPLQFQPKYILHEGKRVEVPNLDADGNVIWEE